MLIATDGKTMNVLLFGAYGNGNLGDAVQAESLRNVIVSIFPKMEFWATTAFREAYPYSADKTLPAGAIEESGYSIKIRCLGNRWRNSALHPHDPLGDPDWARSVPIPFAFISVGAGYSAIFVPSERSGCPRGLGQWQGYRIFEHSAKASAWGAFHAGPGIDRKYDFKKASPSSFETCSILRGPVDENLAFIKAALGPRDAVVGMEPKEDEVLRTLFPDIILLRNFSSARQYYISAKRTVSMRYHGIISLRHGVPAFHYACQKAQHC